MRMRFFGLTFVFIGFFNSSAAHAGARDLVEACRKAASFYDCVYAGFLEISKFHRPSGDEVAIRQFVLDVRRIAHEKHWRLLGRALTFDVDAAGNTVVRGSAKPGSERLAGAVHQAHLDMVVKYKEGYVRQPGESIPLEIDGANNLITHGRVSTNGLDNGWGVAILLGLMVHPEFYEGPEEFVFTTSEETGLTGARAFNLPLAGHYLFNYDGEQPDGKGLEIGTMGGERILASGNVDVVKITGAPVLLDVSVKDLVGGHSGLDADAPRINAAFLAMRMANAVAQEFPETYLVSLQVGTISILNAIPSALDIRFAIDAQRGTAFRQLIREVFAEAISEAKDENRASEVTFTEPHGEEVPEYGFSSATVAKMAETVSGLRNNVIGERHSLYPSGVVSSSNVGALNLSVVGRAGHGELGILARSFDVKRLIEINRAHARQLRDGWPGPAAALTLTSKGITPPWVGKVKGPFVQMLKRVAPTFPMNFALGGAEPAILVPMFPGMEAVMVSLPLADPHTPNERMNLTIAEEVTNLVPNLLREVASLPIPCESAIAPGPRPPIPFALNRSI